jgi:hypothetical protein
MTNTPTSTWFHRFFAAFDAHDVTTLVGFTTEDIQLRLGNAETVHGKTAFVDAVNAFHGSVAAVRYEIHEWCGALGKRNTIDASGRECMEVVDRETSQPFERQNARAAELTMNGRDVDVRIAREVCRKALDVVRFARVIELVPKRRRELLDEVYPVERS